MSDDPRDPLASLLDLFLYAPVGAALHGPEAVEQLAAKGRQDVANARLIGKLAVARGRQQAARIGDDLQDRLGDLFTAAARAAGAPVDGRDDRSGTDAASADTTSSASAGPGTGDAAGPHLSVVPDSAPAAEELAIPDYDNLSASQVVPRLDDLAEEELRAVQEYERAHRGRMTILSRIAQLQAS